MRECILGYRFQPQALPFLGLFGSFGEMLRLGLFWGPSRLPLTVVSQGSLGLAIAGKAGETKKRAVPKTDH